MVVALLLYGYAIGERSSRRLERRCVEDVATRVICANQTPDHTTIARFRQRHETALAELFGEVLALCAEAGLVRVGLIAVDGTKVAALVKEIPGPAKAGRAKVSLRAADQSIDVSAIARAGGGGGHRMAAGFTTTLPEDELVAFLRAEVVAQL